MGATPRRRDTQLPMFTRASDLQIDCWARWFLSHRLSSELPDAGFYILGTAVHETIEAAILEDLDDAEALEYGKEKMQAALDAVENGIIWSKKRNEDTWEKDLTKVINNWFDDVHPDALDRQPEYNKYEWPPVVEPTVNANELGVLGLYTQPDALFKHKRNNYHAVVDWKSGATAKSNPIQLWTYRVGLEEIGIKVNYGWFHHLAFRKLQHIEEWAPRDYVECRILEVEAMKGLGFYNPKPDWYCDYCRAKSMCPIVGGKLGWDDMMELIENSEQMFTPLSEG